MDLYKITYVRKRDGAIDKESPEYNLLVRVNIDMGALEKIARPWFLAYGLDLDDLFLLRTTAFIADKGYNLDQEFRSGMIPLFEEESLFL